MTVALPPLIRRRSRLAVERRWHVEGEVASDGTHVAACDIALAPRGDFEMWLGVSPDNPDLDLCPSCADVVAALVSSAVPLVGWRRLS
jgi:hypothetical protein